VNCYVAVLNKMAVNWTSSTKCSQNNSSNNINNNNFSLLFVNMPQCGGRCEKNLKHERYAFGKSVRTTCKLL
jgi:hypothetical protein